jgi:pyridoxamine 5'-phosphate oxidase
MSKINDYLSNERQNYEAGALDISDVNPNPIQQFNDWMAVAINEKIPEPNAMSLATIANGRPSNRIVLLKGVTESGFIFYTNYESRKGIELQNNPNVSFNIFWQYLSRQIRVEGMAKKISDQESDEYFASRPRESQIGAWASNQSTELENREVIDTNTKHYQKLFEGKNVPRPSHWGGFIIEPTYLEFWQGRSNRLHDRIIYQLENEKWIIKRIAP